MIKRVDNGGQVKLVTNIRKPRKWRRYEYLLLSNSNLYIDTGYCPNTMTTDMLLTFQNMGDNRVMAGVASLIWGTSFCFSTGSISNNSIPCYILYNGATTVGTFNVNTKYTFSYKGTNVNYNRTVIQKNRVNLSIPYSIYLFRLNNQLNTSPYAHTNLKIYEFKLWENNTLVRHMVPAEYQGQYGMWDLVEDKFYKNAGTGTFTVGPEIKNYEEIDEVRRAGSILPAGVELYNYILSSGTLWIDSTWIPNYDKGFEVEAKYNFSSSGSRGCIMSSYNTSKCLSLELINSSRFYFYNGSWDSSKAVTAGADHISNFKYQGTTITHTVDGTVAATTTVLANGISGASAYLFLDRALRTTTFDKLNKIYYITIKEEDLLIHNFLPCTYLGEPGMWDTVENKFYRNQGTGLFTLGNKIVLKEYEYLATTGSLSINNNLILTEGHTLTYDIIFKYDATGVRRLMGPSPNASAYFGVNASNKYEKVSSADNINVGGIDHIYEHFDAINGKITRQLNNLQPYTLDHTIDRMVGSSTFIFALSGSTSYTGSGQYFYSGKILYDGQVVRDYVPCSYNGTYGLWDKVEWKFYGNAGSGSFTVGKEIGGIYPVWRNTTIEDTFTFKLTPNVRRNIATLLGIKGNSIAWNLILSLTVPTTYGATRTNNNDGSFTATPTGTGTFSLAFGTVYNKMLTTSTHKYYISSYISADTGQVMLGYIYYAGSGPSTGYNILITPTTTLTKYAFVATSDVVSSRILGVVSYVNNKPTTFTIKNFMCIDLTLIYGAGNEPTTAEQFEADYYKWFGKPLTYETYDAGSLRSTKCTELKSVGFNQQSENMELGRYALDTGIKYALNNCIRISNPIKVFPNTNYYIHNPYVNDNYYLWILYLDNDDKLIEKINGNNNYIGPENTITTTPINASKLIFYIYGATNYNNDVCINLANSKLNGTYKPYKSLTTSIPVTSITGKLNGSGNSVVIFPDGMKSTGDRWDEIYIEDGITKAIKRIGSISMENANNLVLRNNFSTTGNCYINGFGSAKGIPGVRLVVCSKFSSMPTYSNLISGMSEYIAAENGYKTVNFRVKDHTLTRAQVKEYITGIILYYELEVYLEYIVDNFTLPQLFAVELGGTEEIKSDTISVAPTLLINYTI